MTVEMSAPYSAPNFHVVICHGSFHTPEHYQPLISSLKELGITAECPRLPTSSGPSKTGNVHEGFKQVDNGSDDSTPKASYPLHYDDAAVVRSVIECLVESGKRILVIGHSAGGWPATEAVTSNLEYQSRKRQGLEGGVRGIFYLCAFVLPPGESMDGYWQKTMKPEDIFQNYVFKSWPDQKEGGEITMPFSIVPKAPVAFFYHDLPADEGSEWASKILALPGPQTARLTNASYLSVPCAYLYTETDKVVIPTQQEDMTRKVEPLGVQLKKFRYQGGHSPQLSWTDGVVKAAIEFVAEMDH